MKIIVSIQNGYTIDPATLEGIKLSRPEMDELAESIETAINNQEFSLMRRNAKIVGAEVNVDADE